MSSSPETAEVSWLHLTDDEELLWTDNPCIWEYLPLFAVGIGVIALGAAIGVSIIDLPSVIPIETEVLGVGVIVLGVLLLAATYLQRRSTRFAVTSAEVYHKRGIIARNIDELRLEQIQNTSCNQSILQRLLSYGDVELDTAGGSSIEITIYSVSRPRKVNRIISKQLSELSTDSSMSADGS